MKRKSVIAWAAVVAWMAVIFLFSAQTGDNSGNTSGEIVKWVIGLFYRNFAELSVEKQTKILEIVHLLIRKGAHFSEYAVLALLTANALRPYPLSLLLRWVLPVAFCALYAVTDEIHQYFVPERACRFLDMCIDTAGAVFGVVAFMFLAFMRKYIVQKQQCVR